MEPLPIDYTKKIKILEEELVRKQALIEKLQKENKALFQLALKHSEECTRKETPTQEEAPTNQK